MDFRTGTDSVFKFDVYNENPYLGSNFDTNILFTADSNRVIVNVTDYGHQTSYLYDVDIYSGTAMPIQLPYQGQVLYLSADENSIVWTYEDDPTRIYRKDLNTNATVNADIHESSVNLAASGDYVIVCAADKLYLLDSNLEILTTKNLSQ